MNKMFRRCVVVSLTVILVLVSLASTAFGAAGRVTVSLPGFPVKLNELDTMSYKRHGTHGYGVAVGNEYERYPFLVYKDITYFPMTYSHSNLLNLNTSWTAEGGLVITKGDQETLKDVIFDRAAEKRNGSTQTAAIIDSKVTVNGKVIDNRNEPYPLLLFRDITYFPLTWRFAAEEFGWDYSFDNNGGLVIGTDNYFYTVNADGDINHINEYGNIAYAYAETHYIKGDLRISVINDFTHGLPVGPFRNNLIIVKNGVESRPAGYYGYYLEKEGPLFTIDGNYINTTYSPEIFDVTPFDCRVNIETGQVN